MNDNLPKRKPIRIKSFNYSSIGAYFITICTQERKRILSEVVKTDNAFIKQTNNNTVGDGAYDVPKIQLTETGKIVEKYLLSSERIPGIKIDKYVIMPDHIHAIIIIDNKYFSTILPVSVNCIFGTS